jgi:hypothetical protein
MNHAHVSEEVAIRPAFQDAEYMHLVSAPIAESDVIFAGDSGETPIAPNEERRIVIHSPAFCRPHAIYIEPEVAAAFDITLLASADAIDESDDDVHREDDSPVEFRLGRNFAARVGRNFEARLGRNFAPSPTSAATFVWSCIHSECRGVARDSDDRLLHTPQEAQAMMAQCLKTNFDPRARVLRRIPIPYTTALAFGVKNTSFVARTFRAIIIGLVGAFAPREFVIGFGPQSVAARGRAIFQAQPQLTVRGQRLVIPSSIAASFHIRDMRIGTRSQFNTPQPIPATAFSELAVGVNLGLTVETGTILQLEVENITDEPAMFSGAFIGTALETRKPDAAEVALRAELKDVRIITAPPRSSGQGGYYGPEPTELLRWATAERRLNDERTQRILQSAERLIQQQNGRAATVSHVVRADGNVEASTFAPPTGTWYVGMHGLTENAIITFPREFPAGSSVTGKDEDGSLRDRSITIRDAASASIEGDDELVLDEARVGPMGSITFLKDSDGDWWSV